jgi:hypothetical protein
MKTQAKPQIKETVIAVYLALAVAAVLGNLLFNVLNYYLTL